MPTKVFTYTVNKGIRDGDLAGYWLLNAGDTALPLLASRYSDKSVHIFGNFSGGATVTLKSSNDPLITTFGTARDVFDSLITQGTPGDPRTIGPNVLALMPVITGGDANTAIYVAVVGRGNF